MHQKSASSSIDQFVGQWFIYSFAANVDYFLRWKTKQKNNMQYNTFMQTLQQNHTGYSPRYKKTLYKNAR